jgi:DNA-directed RNA polymerase specialized sigma24 family protein
MNLAINRRRRNRLWRFVGLADAAEPSAAQSRCDGGIPAPVRAAIDKLPAGLKHVLLLTEIAGMTYTEVAASLRIKEGTVGSRRTRALALLRDKLQTEGVYRDES